MIRKYPIVFSFIFKKGSLLLEDRYSCGGGGWGGGFVTFVFPLTAVTIGESLFWNSTILNPNPSLSDVIQASPFPNPGGRNVRNGRKQVVTVEWS